MFLSTRAATARVQTVPLTSRDSCSPNNSQGTDPVPVPRPRLAPPPPPPRRPRPPASRPTPRLLALVDRHAGASIAPAPGHAPQLRALELGDSHGIRGAPEVAWHRGADRHRAHRRGRDPSRGGALRGHGRTAELPSRLTTPSNPRCAALTSTSRGWRDARLRPRRFHGGAARHGLGARRTSRAASGTVTFPIAPAEGGVPTGRARGARMMVEDGIFAKLKPDAVIAFHERLAAGRRMPPTSGFGPPSTRSGPALAAATRLEATVKGRQAHGSAPHPSASTRSSRPPASTRLLQTISLCALPPALRQRHHRRHLPQRRTAQHHPGVPPQLGGTSDLRRRRRSQTI